MTGREGIYRVVQYCPIRQGLSGPFSQIQCVRDFDGWYGEFTLYPTNLAPGAWKWLLYNSTLTLHELCVTGIRNGQLEFGSTGASCAVASAWFNPRLSVHRVRPC